MKRAMLLFAVACLFAAQIHAQTPVAVPIAVPVVCHPTPTLNDLVKALDEAVSGPVDKDRTCLRELLTSDARLVPTSKGIDGSYAAHPLTIDGWIERVKKRGGMLYEVQVKVRPEVYGHIAHLWSTYEIRETSEGKAQVRGINSIQAINDGTRWRIFEVFWQAETPEEKVPEKYLP